MRHPEAIGTAGEVFRERSRKNYQEKVPIVAGAKIQLCNVAGCCAIHVCSLRKEGETHKDYTGRVRFDPDMPDESDLAYGQKHRKHYGDQINT